MKRKIISVLLTLVLVLSFSLITAVPAAAASTLNVRPYTLDSTGADTAAWSTVQKSTGSYSVLLTYVSGDNAYVEFTPPTGTTVNDLATITDGWSWWYYASAANGPLLELRFTSGSGHVDITVNTAEASPTLTTGTTEEVTNASTCIYFGNDPTDGTGFYDSTGSVTLAGVLAAINAEPEMTAGSDTATAWVLTRVRAEIGWVAGARTCYIDDIEIAGVTYYGSIKDAIDSATTGDTISVAAGTYDAELSWPIAVNKALTIQGAAGKTSIIDPGSAGQGVIAISVDSVTLDGFTITHGTLASDATHPVENTIWVAAEYSTIKNNTITGTGGTASIYIGGRTDPGDAYAQWLYGTGEPLGHTIQDNVINHRNSGEGWGIFAVELTDSLIHGNSFTGLSTVGDGRTTAWNTTVGTPGTCIIIHTATFGNATGAPGGGYVVVEDNTASWVKYTFMNFTASLMLADDDGVFYEKAVAGTVDGVIVRNNTVTNVGKNSTDYNSGNIVNFQAESKVYNGTPTGASLTIGSNKITIGPGNDFQTADNLIKIKDPKIATATYFGVKTANNIVVKHNNFAGAQSYGIYNGTTHVNQDADSLGGDAVIVALYNYWGATLDGPYHATTNINGTGSALTDSVTFKPWLYYTTAANGGNTLANIVANQVPAYAQSVDLSVGWNTWSVPIGLDGQYNTWAELYTLTTLPYTLAYRFDTSSQTFVGLATTSTYAIAPGEGFYVKMTSADSIPYCYSTLFSIPSRSLSASWNLVGGGLTTRTEIVSCASVIAAGGTAGYTHIVGPAENAAGSYVYIAGGGTAGNFVAGEGYWAFLAIARTLGLFDLTPVAWVP